MKRQIPALQRIGNNDAITNETNPDFLYHLKYSLLLALLERGRLDAIQYRRAEEALKKQRTRAGELP